MQRLQLLMLQNVAGGTSARGVKKLEARGVVIVSDYWHVPHYSATKDKARPWAQSEADYVERGRRTAAVLASVTAPSIDPRYGAAIRG